jgi:hypothetical protein
MLYPHDTAYPYLRELASIPEEYLGVSLMSFLHKAHTLLCTLKQREGPFTVGLLVIWVDTASDLEDGRAFEPLD